MSGGGGTEGEPLREVPRAAGSPRCPAELDLLSLYCFSFSQSSLDSGVHVHCGDSARSLGMDAGDLWSRGR